MTYFKGMQTLNLFSQEQIQDFQSLVPSGEIPLWQYWDAFQERYLESGRSPITVRNVRDAIKFVVMRLNLVSLEQINRSSVFEDALFGYRKSAGISNVTYNTYLKNLNTYFKWLEQHGHISINGLRKIMRCKEEINEQYTLSEEQVRSVMGHIYTRQQNKLERLRNTFFIQLLRFTGARPCELLGIRYQDLKLIGGVYKLMIRGRKQKGRKRFYNLDSAVRDAFEPYAAYRSLSRPNEHMLFVSCSGAGGWTDKGMRGLFRRLSDELGFRVSAYGFRRYVATRLNTKGLEMKDIQNYMGHTRATTTQRYIERSGILTAKGSDAMSDFLFYPKLILDTGPTLHF